MIVKVILVPTCTKELGGGVPGTAGVPGLPSDGGTAGISAFPNSTPFSSVVYQVCGV